MALLEPQDVKDLLPAYNLTDAQLSVAMRIVAGWLKRAAGLNERPDELTEDDDLWSPAVELVGLIAENPTSLASRTAGPTSRTWPQAARRDAILAEVRADAERVSSAPSGSFPDPVSWPDPTRFYQVGESARADVWLY